MHLRFIIAVFAIIFLAAGGIFFFQPFPQITVGSDEGSEASISSSPSSLTPSSSLPHLTLPEEFSIDVFADDLPGARVIVQDKLGNFWVSRPAAGVVTLLVVENGKVVQKNDVFRGLARPHGLAIDPKNGLDLYIAEEHRITRTSLYSDGDMQEIASLPDTGRHWTRTLGFGPDDRLYVSIGSTCDVCVEQDELHSTILSMNRDGSDQKIVAQGLRNAVFFTWSFVDGRMWATEMGRDNLGDNLPPDEINIIEEGKNYGWPWCYGKQVRDQKFEPQKPFDCTQTESSAMNLQAHVAPLGLTFIPEEGWPEEYWYDILVAEHGSWNRSTPVGYQIERIPLDAEGNLEGSVEPFVHGWLENYGIRHGRPVDLLAQPGGILYITDDYAGKVYRLTTREPQ